MIDGTKGVSFIKPVNLTLTQDKSSEVNMDIGSSFGEFLNDAMKKVSDIEKESTALGESFAAGTEDNIHKVMIAGQKAEIALQFTMQIRNKILDAYNEIMRMQI